MRFYKRKRFYIPFLAIILILITVVFLVASPSGLIVWNNFDYRMEAERLDKMLNGVKDDKESLNEFLKNYTLDRYEFFYPAFYYSKTAKRDFIVARFLDWDEDYVEAYKKAISKAFSLIDFAHLISLGLKHNVSNLTKEHIQFLSFVESRGLLFLKNTQELIDYLAENDYFNNEKYRIIHLYRMNYISMYLILLVEQKECFSKEKKTILFKQIQEDYQVLQSAKNDNMKKLSDRVLSEIIQIKERINECQ